MARAPDGHMLNLSDWLSLASAASGVFGILILFASSYAPPPVPAPSLLPEDDPVERQKVLRDTARRARQTRHRLRVGLAFLGVGFFLQGVAILCPH
jgi:hypothetical protein